MFTFEANIKTDNKEIFTLVVFFGQDLGEEVNYSYRIETEFHKQVLRPEEIFLIFPGYLKDRVSPLMSNSGKFKDNYMRFGEDIPVTAVFFDFRGNFTFYSLNKNSTFSGSEEKVRDSIIKEGLFHLASKRREQVVLKSPSGTAFIKPSKKEYSEFIKAGELAIGAYENQFVAFTLLSKMPERVVRNIYIDSNSIAAYVEALIFYMTTFENSHCRAATYFSFGSYVGMADFKPDDVDEVWVIISASTSNNMGVDLAKKWRLENDQVVTILSYKDSRDEQIGDNIILNIRSLSTFIASSPNSSQIKIKVVGENFYAEAEQPYPVTIKAAHKPSGVDWIQSIGASDVIKCNKRVSASDPVNPVYLDCSSYFLEDQKFLTWLKNVLNWYLPISLAFIVYREIDKASVILKNIVVDSLKAKGIFNFQVIDIERANYDISGAGSSLILMPVTGTGETFLKLNRNMRISGHTGNRIFISPFVLFSSKEGFARFKNSLVFGPNSFKYQFFSYNNAFLGHGRESSSWTLELEVIERLKNEFWKARANRLRNVSEGVGGYLGTPSLTLNEKLSFSKDFAFWDSRYEPNDVRHETVYLTISAILQSLREKPITDSDRDSLFSYVYQHSVLDPENFVRFNDGLLQCCLWRAADSRELDYRSSDELSKKFMTILDRLALENFKGNESSAVDLLMGIATGKIRITNTILGSFLEKLKIGYGGSGKCHVVELIEIIRYDVLGEDTNSKDDLAF